jgi:hypothetical protein
MEKTKEGYMIPEKDNEEELMEAMKNNSELDAKLWNQKTLEEQDKFLKMQQKYNTPLPTLKIDKYLDNVKTFHNINPFFYDKNEIFWLWNKNKNKYDMSNETDMMILIDQSLSFGGQTVSRGIKGNYLEAFKRVGRINIPKETPNLTAM